MAPSKCAIFQKISEIQENFTQCTANYSLSGWAIRKDGHRGMLLMKWERKSPPFFPYSFNLSKCAKQKYGSSSIRIADSLSFKATVLHRLIGFFDNKRDVKIDSSTLSCQAFLFFFQPRWRHNDHLSLAQAFLIKIGFYEQLSFILKMTANNQPL